MFCEYLFCFLFHYLEINDFFVVGNIHVAVLLNKKKSVVYKVDRIIAKIIYFLKPSIYYFIIDRLSHLFQSICFPKEIKF